MTFEEYEKLAMRTDDPKIYTGPISMLINALMGLNGEAGEAIDVLKKALYQGHELKKEKLIEELGDVLWYVALAAKAIDVPLSTIADVNILKLVKRFPNGFTQKDSIERKDISEVNDDPNGESVMPEMRDES